LIVRQILSPLKEGLFLPPPHPDDRRHRPPFNPLRGYPRSPTSKRRKAKKRQTKSPLPLSFDKPSLSHTRVPLLCVCPLNPLVVLLNSRVGRSEGALPSPRHSRPAPVVMARAPPRRAGAKAAALLLAVLVVSRFCGVERTRGARGDLESQRPLPRLLFALPSRFPNATNGLGALSSRARFPRASGRVTQRHPEHMRARAPPARSAPARARPWTDGACARQRRPAALSAASGRE
jgi:hypothetical protein